MQDFEVSVDFVETDIGCYSSQTLAVVCMAIVQRVNGMTRQESVYHFVEELE